MTPVLSAVIVDLSAPSEDEADCAVTFFYASPFSSGTVPVIAPVAKRHEMLSSRKKAILRLHIG